MERLRVNSWPILQTAVAAGLSWLIATKLLGHSNPVFAPIAAIVSLGATRGQRSRRAISLILGVAIGIGLGEVIIRAVGVGVLQLTVTVGVAMVAATMLGNELLLVSEAAVSAVLVVTLSPATRGFPPTRLVDSLMGGAVALVFSQLLFPVHPVRMVRDAAESVLRELADTLAAVADAIENADLPRAEAALAKARRISSVWGGFEQALDIGWEAARYAPPRRRLRRPFIVYRDIGLPLDLVVRDVHVLARAAVRALTLDEALPANLADALRDLGQAASLLAAAVGDDVGHDSARSLTLRAVYAATELAGEVQNVSLGVLVAYTQAAGVDLLRASGIDRDPAQDKVIRAAEAAAM
jgi:uncharacterized membrane protein YgaE (UPF0421/DUF939 family)